MAGDGGLGGECWESRDRRVLPLVGWREGCLQEGCFGIAFLTAGARPHQIWGAQVLTSRSLLASGLEAGSHSKAFAGVQNTLGWWVLKAGTAGCWPHTLDPWRPPEAFPSSARGSRWGAGAEKPGPPQHSRAAASVVLMHVRHHAQVREGEQHFLTPLSTVGLTRNIKVDGERWWLLPSLPPVLLWSKL